MVLHPRHRGDCAEFFVAPDKTARMQLDASANVIGEIRHAAARTGRTWNDQFTYVMGVYLSDHLPAFDDGRSVEDWRDLLSPCRLRLSEAENWIPFACL